MDTQLSRGLVVSCLIALLPIRPAAQCAPKTRPPVPISGALCGQAFDSAGAQIQNGELHLVDQNGSIVATAKTNWKADYRFRRVPRGTYSVISPGFSPSFDTVAITDANASACKRRLNLEFGVGECSTRFHSGAGVRLGLRNRIHTTGNLFIDGRPFGDFDFDAVQFVELDPGPHHIEIVVPGFQRMTIDVQVREFEALTHRLTPKRVK
jgi:hypothetical protein